jgi:hypothetical protein
MSAGITGAAPCAAADTAKWAGNYQLTAAQRAWLQRTKMIDSGKKTADITEM